MFFKVLYGHFIFQCRSMIKCSVSASPARAGGGIEECNSCRRQEAARGRCHCAACSSGHLPSPEPAQALPPAALR